MTATITLRHRRQWRARAFRLAPDAISDPHHRAHLRGLQQLQHAEAHPPSVWLAAERGAVRLLRAHPSQSPAGAPASRDGRCSPISCRCAPARDGPLRRPTTASGAASDRGWRLTPSMATPSRARRSNVVRQPVHPVGGRVEGAGAEGSSSTRAYPFGEQVTLRVTKAPRAPTAIALRLPGWCDAPALTVDGKPQPINRAAGYARIERRWRDRRPDRAGPADARSNRADARRSAHACLSERSARARCRSRSGGEPFDGPTPALVSEDPAAALSRIDPLPSIATASSTRGRRR